jgi:hypothetical protein
MALQINQVLQSLDLTSNEINDIGMASLADAMRSNSTCQKLLLWGNDFGVESSSIFLDLFEGRFKYFEWVTDFRPYVVDGEVHISHVQV